MNAILKDKINKYTPINEQEEKDKLTTLKFIETFDDVLTRQNEFGHFTSSSWIVNKQRTKALMIYHNIYDSWAWTGGHADGDENLLNVAIKEAKEETGITKIKPVVNDIFSLEIICVNGHVKKGKYVSSHLHFNTSFLLEADDSEDLKINEEENSGVKWFDIKEAVEMSKEPWVKNIYQKIVNKMGNGKY